MTARSSSARSSIAPAQSPLWRTTGSSCTSSASRGRQSAIRTASSSRPVCSTRTASQPAETARRELIEEIGKAPGKLEHLLTYYSSVGSSDEQVHLYLATDLSDEHADSGENERIEIVRWPLADLDGAIAATQDAKTLLGLRFLR